ncbi:MAG: phosphodiester glycosidase family protein [Candidatus Polarisedimenticolia bacterium]
MIASRLLLTAALAAATAAPGPAPASHPPWRTLAPGLEFRSMDGGSGARKGDRRVVVLRADPERWRLDLFHQSEPAAGKGSRDAEGWQRLTGAAVVLNAGQYYPDRIPMGIFVKQGRNLGTKLLPHWKGVLAGEPRATPLGPRVTILDLEHDPFKLDTSPWQVAMQSFMLLDRDGRKRVRRSDWHASRSAAAIDRTGRLLLFHTEGAWTLWELADWMSRSDLNVLQALSMDGGYEAQMCVRQGDFSYTSFGGWHVDDRGDHSMPGLRVTLPAVVALFPR